MRGENINWGAPRIWQELSHLGFGISLTTVQNYLNTFGSNRPKTKHSQTWLTFIRNNMVDAVGMDFFVVPTALFQFYYVFIILSHDRRKIIHWNFTQNPTQDWTRQQIINAFALSDNKVPKYIHHDRDSILMYKVKTLIESMNIESVPSSYRSPWQNCFCERVIGSIRRECLNHVIILGDHHLRKMMSKYVDYYNNYRLHLSLDVDFPFY